MIGLRLHVINSEFQWVLTEAYHQEAISSDQKRVTKIEVICFCCWSLYGFRIFPPLEGAHEVGLGLV